MAQTLSAVYAIADRFVEELAALDPIEATEMGVSGHDDELPDLSPAGHEARDELLARTLDALRAAPLEEPGDALARAVMTERLGLARDLHASGEDLRDVRVLGSTLGAVRSTFDLMRYETDDDWSIAARRMRRVPQALEGWRASLREGVARGLVAARRQAVAVAAQGRAWSGTDAAATRPYFHTIVDRYEQHGPTDDALLTELRDAADAATGAFAETAQFLADEYAPAASERDGVGRERYVRLARGYLGSEIDVDDTYAWGWAELARIETRIAEVCDAIRPSASFEDVVAVLESDPAYVKRGADSFIAWNQEIIDRTITDMDGRHFDIPAPLQRCEAMIAPPGGAAAAYYTPPNEDFTRPGRTWYPTIGRTEFPLWREMSICFHEAVPGHHLQIGHGAFLADRLSRFQRVAGFVSGHGEGWALYAERLMAELGYFEDPAYELGMLASQAMRAVRVIVDIGMHLELEIPATSSYAPVERWTPELALPFVIERSRFPEAFMRSEVDRYLGLPGQAISYKVGERVWLDCRADAQRRHGASFDLKAWHTYALDLGSLGLDTLREELARF